MSLKVLFVDDDACRHSIVRSFCDRITHAHNAAEAIGFLGVRAFDVVFLDHDLGRAAGPTGLTVARHLVDVVDRSWWPRQVVVHSQNPVGTDNILATLRGAGLEVHRVAFGSQIFYQILSQIRDLLGPDPEGVKGA